MGHSRDTTDDSLTAQDLSRLFHPATNLAVHHEKGPLMVTRGEGIRVWDQDGNEYIEGMSGLWCTSLGYGEEELARSAYEQMRILPFGHLFGGKSHPAGVALAEKLVSMAPFEASRVFFANSGSEANDTQVKLVWYYNNAIGRPNKKKIISRHKGYHGTTIAAAGLTGLPSFHSGFDVPMPRIIHTDCPYYYRGAERGESEEDYASRLVNNLEELIIAEDPDTVAAFIAEPMIGVGGVILPPATYFKKAQEVLEKYDIFLIDDEVITGFGRTGEIWGAQSFGMKPTTLTAAKALSSAYLPISAVFVPEFLYEPMIEASGRAGIFGHGFTYSGHPVSAAVALRALELYEERKLYDHVRRVSPYFQSRFREMLDHPLVGDVRGIGLVGACELVKDKQSKESFRPENSVGFYLAERCQAHGLIARALGDIVALCPPYIVTESDIDEIFDRYAKGLDDTLKWAHKERYL